MYLRECSWNRQSTPNCSFWKRTRRQETTHASLIKASPTRTWSPPSSQPSPTTITPSTTPSTYNQHYPWLSSKTSSATLHSSADPLNPGPEHPDSASTICLNIRTLTLTVTTAMGTSCIGSADDFLPPEHAGGGAYSAEARDWEGSEAEGYVRHIRPFTPRTPARSSENCYHKDHHLDFSESFHDKAGGPIIACSAPGRLSPPSLAYISSPSSPSYLPAPSPVYLSSPPSPAHSPSIPSYLSQVGESEEEAKKRAKEAVRRASRKRMDHRGYLWFDGWSYSHDVAIGHGGWLEGKTVSEGLRDLGYGDHAEYKLAKDFLWSTADLAYSKDVEFIQSSVVIDFVRRAWNP